MHGSRSRILVVATVAALTLALPMATAGVSPARPLARNVILLIDDGAGYNHHEVGSLFDTGLRAGKAYNAFPFLFAVATYSYGDEEVGACASLTSYDPERAWSEWAYVIDDPTDSAAAATAMATGAKTYNGAIGVGCDGEDVANVVEAYEALGKATGLVTSVPFDHATPAGFVAHNPDRGDFQGIAREMIWDSAVDVVMGAGHPLYNRFGTRAPTPGHKYISVEDWAALSGGTAGGDADADGDVDTWTFVEAKAAFQGLASGPTPSRVFGMATVRETLQQDRLRTGVVNPPPYTIPFNASVPTLAEMAAGAINVLDEDPDGFFLMVEGGATDMAASARQEGLVIEEEIAFDDAVDAVLDWVDQHSNWGETLVIVTSDHETAYLTGPGSGDTPDGPVWTPIVDNGIGVMPGMQFNQKPHTNSLVPLYAKGDAGRLLRRLVDGTDPVRGLYLDNTDIHTLLIEAAGG